MNILYFDTDKCAFDEAEQIVKHLAKYGIEVIALPNFMSLQPIQDEPNNPFNYQRMM